MFTGSGRESEVFLMFRHPLLFVSYLVLSAVLLLACNSPAPLSPSPSAQQHPTTPPNGIRLATGEWAPYIGENLPHAGCDSWVVTEAFALEGLSVEYGFFPWARSYSLSATGKWDGTPEWADTPDHQLQHYVSAEPLSTQEWVFFYRADRPLTWETLDDLAGKTIGVTSGYFYSNAFRDLRTKGVASFVESSSDEANFRMLLAGRIDVFPMERHVGRSVVRSIFTPEEQAQLLGSSKSFAQFKPYLLLSRAVRQNEQRMELFDRGFKRLQTSGRYAEIMQSCVP